MIGGYFRTEGDRHWIGRTTWGETNRGSEQRSATTLPKTDDAVFAAGGPRLESLWERSVAEHSQIAVGSPNNSNGHFQNDIGSRILSPQQVSAVSPGQFPCVRETPAFARVTPRSQSLWRPNGQRPGPKSTYLRSESLLPFFQFPFSTGRDWFDNGGDRFATYCRAPFQMPG